MSLPEDPTKQALGKRETVSHSWRRIALTVSVVFHVLLIGLLAVWYVNRPQEKPTQQEDTQKLARAEQEIEHNAAPSQNAPEPSPDVNRSQVVNTLERVQDVYEEKPAKEQLSDLDEKAAELEKLATVESIDEITQKFHEWTNIAPRAGEPSVEPVEGRFDFRTAQIHDVAKTTSEDGVVQYRSVLVDAAGRTYEVELPGEEGEQAYRTMQTLKKYPLADRVYRQIAMPLIDQAIASASDSAGADNGEIDAPPNGADDRDPFDGQLDDSPSERQDQAPEPDDARDPFAANEN